MSNKSFDKNNRVSWLTTCLILIILYYASERIEIPFLGVLVALSLFGLLFYVADWKRYFKRG